VSLARAQVDVLNGRHIEIGGSAVTVIDGRIAV
jgi:hypothetical protein